MKSKETMSALLTAVQTELTHTNKLVNTEQPTLTTSIMDGTNATLAGLLTNDNKPTTTVNQYGVDDENKHQQIPVITMATCETPSIENKKTNEKKPYGGRPLRFQCTKCDRRFHAPSHLKRHMLCHSTERPFQCHICEKGFLQAWHLGRHMTTHTGNKPFQCPECPKTFGSRFEMKTHCNYIHRGIKEHECTVCKKMFTLRSNLKVHMRKHTGEKPYECTICSKKFGQRGHLQYHLRKHTNEQKTQIEQRERLVVEDLLKPEEVEGMENKQYSYDSGVESTGSEKSRSISPIYMINNSPKITAAPVKLISNRVINQSSANLQSSLPLSGRIFDHTNPKELKPYVCDSCNCGFAEINSLRSHVRHSHPKKGITKPVFSCAYCNRFFYDIDVLRQHFYYTHVVATAENLKEPLFSIEKPYEQRRVGDKFRSLPDINEYLSKRPYNGTSSPYGRSPSVKSTASDPSFDRINSKSPFAGLSYYSEVNRSPVSTPSYSENSYRKSPTGYFTFTEKTTSPKNFIQYPDKIYSKSPSSFSTLSDTTYDRKPVLQKYPSCPVGCKCNAPSIERTLYEKTPFEKAPPLISSVVEGRYLYHMEQYQKFLDSHVSLMEALQYNRRK